MTEEIQSEQTVYNQDELNEMFDATFLPNLQKFAKRLRDGHPDNKFIGYKATLELAFFDLEKPLTFAALGDQVHMQLMPLEQKDEEIVEEEVEETADQA